MSDLDRITSTDEITRILKVAETTNAEVYCEINTVGAPPLVHLEVRRAIGTNIVFGIKRLPNETAKLLAAVFTNGLQAGTPIDVVISLVDGQYAIRDIVQDVSLSTFTVSAGKNLLRLQRRKDFRVSVRTDGLKAKLKIGNDEHVMSLLDLSAGGLRLLWPPTAGPIPAMGTVLSPSLILRDEKVVNVEMKFVKDHGPDAPLKPELGRALSFQFQNVPQEESRAILFTCLFIHRNSYQ